MGRQHADERAALGVADRRAYVDETDRLPVARVAQMAVQQHGVVQPAQIVGVRRMLEDGPVRDVAPDQQAVGRGDHRTVGPDHAGPGYLRRRLVQTMDCGGRLLRREVGLKEYGVSVETRL
jgi:hypothetical protein